MNIENTNKEKESEEIKKDYKNNHKKKKFNFSSFITLKIIGVLVLIIIILVGSLALVINLNKDEKEKSIITKATLEKIIDVSDLSTFEAIYNGVAKSMNKEKPEKIDYHVSYEAKVKAGIDFDKVNISIDNEKKNITVIIPKVKITEVIVDITSLDYLFQNKKANDESVSEEAYKLCIEDVEKESATNSAIYELAEENAKSIIEALIKPFINQLDSQYTLEIK